MTQKDVLDELVNVTADVAIFAIPEDEGQAMRDGLIHLLAKFEKTEEEILAQCMNVYLLICHDICTGKLDIESQRLTVTRRVRSVMFATNDAAQFFRDGVREDLLRSGATEEDFRLLAGTAALCVSEAFYRTGEFLAGAAGAKVPCRDSSAQPSSGRFR